MHCSIEEQENEAVDPSKVQDSAHWNLDLYSSRDDLEDKSPCKEENKEDEVEMVEYQT